MAGQRVQNFIASLMRNFIASSRGEVYIYMNFIRRACVALVMCLCACVMPIGISQP